MAQCEAARFALMCAKKRGWKKVLTGHGSLGLISRLQSGREVHTYKDILLEDIWSLVPPFDSLWSSHVKRADNIIVHLVARYNPINGFEQFVCNEFPPDVVSLSELERINE